MVDTLDSGSSERKLVEVQLLSRAQMKPLGRVNCDWRPELAYAVGLIATDGCLSGDGRHIDLTSKDVEQLDNFKKCLVINHKVTTKKSGYNGDISSCIQFSDKNFYNFLFSIGLTPKKSLTLADLAIPDELFWDFLRGHLDGDGCTYSYWDKRWRSSFMFYTAFSSSSINHVYWLRAKITNLLGISGHIHVDEKGLNNNYQLRFAKNDSVKLLNKMYNSSKIVCLRRKREKIEKALLNARVL